MNNLNEKEFNEKFRHLLKRFVLKESSSENQGYKPLKSNDRSFDEQIFVAVNGQSKTISVSSLAYTRLILLANFAARFLGNKIDVNVCCANETDKENLKNILDLYNLHQNLNIYFKTFEVEVPEKYLEKIDTQFKLTDKDNDIQVNFGQIASNFSLKNYDSNLKIGYVDSVMITGLCYQEFLTKNLKNSSKILTICLNSEFFQHQKFDLILRAFNGNEESHKFYTHNFICTGNVKVDENETSTIKVTNDFFDHYRSRKEFFKYSAEQRQMTPEELSEANIENLTLFSIIFDLFNTNHQIDIKKFKYIDLSQMELDDKVKLGEQSSFILYNCARISAIFDKFDTYVKQGRFNELPKIDDLDFFTLLKTDYEKKICSQFLFKFESIMDEIYDSLNQIKDSSLQIKINISKLFSFMSDLINQFSKYYSKIHILEDPKFDHLHNIMHARIYLIKLIFNFVKIILGMFNIDPLRRI
ncbi:unnamed protein product [Brachionus calyciflorus]|uniref:DALR anticodon binding domain-containing protein n=1 Tax=Brachionus calyciflorus TaxID=104777 RepID=A0A813RIX4_9BILA|nr:unnamed protein product [Brachionus calyciflorus]